MLRVIMLSLIVSMFHVAGIAREPIFKTYSTENGLSHDGVLCVLEDQDGFMWFGTWDGLNRFDGNKFVVYKSQPGDQSSLKNNKIRDIVEDSLGYLWIKTYDKKVYRFDKRTEEFFAITTTDKGADLAYAFIDAIVPLKNGDVWLTTEDNEAICVSNIENGALSVINYSMETAYLGRNVNFVYEDDQKEVWFGTKSGLISLSKVASGYKPSWGGSYKVYGKSLDFTAVAAEKMGRLFFATTEGILVIFDPKSKLFQSKKVMSGAISDILVSRAGTIYLTGLNHGLVSYNHQNGISKQHDQVNYLSMYEDHDGNIWLEPSLDGAVIFRPSTESFQTFTHRKEQHLPFRAPEGVMNDRSFKVFEDVNGTVWIRLKGGGFGYYDKERRTIAYFYNDPLDKKRLFSNNLVTSYTDKNGVLWLCTRNGGIHKVSFFSDIFQHRRLVSSTPNQFDNEVRAFLQDSDGKIWITTKSGEVYFYKDGVTQVWQHGPITGSIYCIVEDRQKNIWIGTKGFGLIKLQPENELRTAYKAIRYVHDPNDVNSLSSNQVYSITEDHKGRLWVSTFQKGPNLLLEENGKTFFKNVNNSFKNYPKRVFNVIRHAIQGPDKRIWLGTTDGLLRFDPDEDPDTMNFLPTVKIAGDKTSLGNNDITYIFRATDNSMWVGTFGGGLNKVLDEPGQIHEELQFEVFSKKQGLPNDIVLSVLEDRKRNLWITTQNGIAVMNRETEDFRNYNAYNGLPKIGFSEAACLQSNQGELFFGGLDGYVSIYPERMMNEKTRGNMVLTGLQLYNNDLDIKDPNSPLNISVNYADEIVLNHDQDVITLEYAVLDYRTPDDISYAYMLEGYDKDWHFVKNQKKATYTKIPPGRYVFRVKTVNSNYFENEPEKQISIIVKHPWWLQNWAILSYIVLTICTLEVVRRIIYTMLHLKNKIAVEKKMTELKLQFFTNISHELRTPLTLIVNPLDKIKQTESLSEKGEKYLHVANKNTIRLLRFVNQLLDFRKIQSQKATLHVSKVDMTYLIQQLLDNFADIVEDKKVSLEFISTTTNMEIWCDEEKIDMVFFNLITNAIKFSPRGGKITIWIEEKGQSVQISIIDEGGGVQEDQLDLIFEPYYEGGNVDSKISKGTGIGLSLSKEIVSLHSGTIYAEKNTGSGMTFIVRLLKGSEHFDTADLAEDRSDKKEDRVPMYNVGEHKQKEHEPEIVSKAEQPTLLLVEDNPELRGFIAEEFRSTYRVYEAADGQEGYRKATDYIPDVIISDVMMPEMDGVHMLKKLKDNLNTSHIPIVLLTAKSAIEDQIEGLSYGADFYVTKPFHIDYVKHLIRNLLRSRQRVVEDIIDRPTILNLEPKEVIITSKDELFIRDVIHIVEEGMSDTDFTIDTAVNAMAMGRTTFYKKLKSLTNMSPVEFVRDIRLKRAKQLLESGEFTVTEIAYKVGFNSSGYFSTCFKEKYKVSPSEYMKSGFVQP